MPHTPRAALLASWATAFLQGSAELEQAVSAIEDADEPHLVVSHPLAEPVELGEALVELREQRLVGLRLALPVPGDLLGLTGPPQVNRAALAAGEAAVGVVAEGSASPASVPALVPDVRAFGSPGDQGHCVTWRTSEASPARPDVPTLAEADRELTLAMRESTATLSSIATGSWGSDARDVAGSLRASSRPLMLPSSLGARAESLAERALTVLQILDAARADDGGALTSHTVLARAAALAPLDRAARRALVAATGATLEQARHPSALDPLRQR
jgi:hypothetical protein